MRANPRVDWVKFGRAIKRARGLRQLPTADLAARIGMPLRTLERIQTGQSKLSPAVFDALNEVLHGALDEWSDRLFAHVENRSESRARSSSAPLGESVPRRDAGAEGATQRRALKTVRRRSMKKATKKK